MQKGAIMERATTGIAAVGVTFPAWEAELHHIGALASTMVPIVSVAWLLVQIGVFAWRNFKGSNHG